jgi:spermidine/putrescine transport system substrate-binding protein
MQRNVKVSRRRFLKVMGAAGVAGSTLSILSCQPNTSTQQGGGGGGGGGPEEKQLNLYNWSDYVAESTIPSFEKKTGIQVTQDVYSSNEELLAKLQAGGVGYDVIVPSDYMVEIMIKSDVIQKIDKSKIPNFENVSEEFKGLPFDPNNDYSLPYQWGTTGILYNEKEVGKIDSWDALWNPEFEGQIGMMNDSRETIGAALYRLGYSVNTTDPDQLQEAKASLIEQSPLVRGYFGSTQNRPSVVRGDLLLGHVYSGDGFWAAADNDELAYTIPMPAATRWIDNMTIPNGAPHPDNAHKFINHILDAKVGAELSNYTYFATPNKAALPMIDKALLDIPTYNPPPEVFERLELIEDVGEQTREYERIFTEVKSA